MQPLMLLAATEDAAHSHSLLDALPHLAGMLMVMVILALLWGVCAFTATIIKLLLREPKPTTAPTAPAPSPRAESGITSEVAPEVAPEIIAVIAAAVATVTDNQPVRIISIKPMSTSWERAGRQSVLTSHRIR